jgi:hypothetical protein
MLSLEWLAHAPISLGHVCFWYPFLEPRLTTYHSSLDVSKAETHLLHQTLEHSSTCHHRTLSVSKP